MKSFKGEKLEKETTTQRIYYYYDEELGIKQKSKIEYKNKDVVVHFPRGFEGGPKYTTIEKFTFIGFGKHLPIGVFKVASRGYGFTKTLKPFGYFLNDEYAFREIIIEKGGKTEIDEESNKLYLSDTSLQTLNSALDSVFKKNRDSVDAVLWTALFELFPENIEKPVSSYIPNSISTSLLQWGQSIEEFSDTDKSSILDLFDKLSLTPDFLTNESLSKTKEIIDNKYIQETLAEFMAIKALTADGGRLEKRWQGFLKKNSWIFSTIFAQPVILYKDEAYVGGKTMDNHNGKFNDFLIQSSLSKNVSFLEIKTHLTKLMDNTEYRGSDVFSSSKDLSGSIVQVLNQRDNFQKEFYQTKVKSKADLESFNSRCVVLIGSLEKLTEEQKYAFELFRSNSKDVEIITFDELQKKIESLQKMMSQ